MNEDSAETSQIGMNFAVSKVVVTDRSGQGMRASTSAGRRRNLPRKGVRLNLGIIAAIYVKLRDAVIRVKDLVPKEKKGQGYLKERIPVIGTFRPAEVDKEKD